jgi:hypothetical protein
MSLISKEDITCWENHYYSTINIGLYTNSKSLNKSINTSEIAINTDITSPFFSVHIIAFHLKAGVGYELEVEELEFDSRQGQKIFPLSTNCRPALGPI